MDKRTETQLRERPKCSSYSDFQKGPTPIRESSTMQ